MTAKVKAQLGIRLYDSNHSLFESNTFTAGAGWCQTFRTISFVNVPGAFYNLPVRDYKNRSGKIHYVRAPFINNAIIFLLITNFLWAI
jgi:hypothetical protein